jgi:hypothetical protein
MANSPSLARRALNIAQLEFNARFNDGQGRHVNAVNAANLLRALYGNAVANNALRRARGVIRKTNQRKIKRVNNIVRTAAQRFLNARGRARERAGRALMAPVLAELNALRWVPVNNFRVKRGRSPSPLRSPQQVRKARRYTI